MPVTPDNSPGYELGYTYQMASIYISALLFIAVDSVALSMIMFGCAQLLMIMDKIQKVWSYCKTHIKYCVLRFKYIILFNFSI